MLDYKKFRDKQLKENPKLKRYYDELEPEYAVIRAVMRKRLKKGMTQSQLARKIGTKQSAIARLESGSHNPSFAMLKKVAKALDAKLVVAIK
ncbi:transcriptional regulator [bacterium CG10_46_32]|nr:MAG: transcriptional regulator [bacterium CG10_46_32]PIR55939.1 MAG: transcriptional regulator [Parcubacteria group bacterium CG10_big_fil_rev_8_21_14_0_10_46_32]